MATIDSNPASGTQDFLPEAMARRHHAFALVRDVYERYGFQPMDTPAFERLDVLLGKYGDESEKLIFKILKRGEQEETGQADLALRYDLTVPLARFAAANSGTLPMPFKRYVIAPVWRAERPQKGRFREFFQCDIDTIGSDSPLADAEPVIAASEVYAGLGLEDFTVHVNSRQALRALVESYGIPEEFEETALVAIDKLDRVGADGVARELRDREVPAELDALTQDLAADDLEERARDRLAGTERGAAGLAQADAVLALIDGHLVGGQARFDPVLARGLGYYTGPIFEVRHAGIGSSIGGGGRYDGLIGMFMGNDVPATGFSIGIERLLLLLEEQGRDHSSVPTVLVTVFDEDARVDAIGLAVRLRRAGIDTDLYAGDGKLGKQFKYADRRGIRYALIRGSDEREAGTVAVKDLDSGDQVDVAEADLVEHVQRRLL
ncbi:MAG TPA: histidine--tRNA ligase [Nitriliruptorales bacterium]